MLSVRALQIVAATAALTGGVAWGQSVPAPWRTHTADIEGIAPLSVDAAPPRAARWPTITPRPARPAAPTVLGYSGPRALPRDDPGEGHYFQMPTARLLRYGDIEGHYLSALGWVSARAGLSRYVDVGVGVPYYLTGISVEARVAFVQRPRFSAAWWGYATVPFLEGGAHSTTSLGFTWRFAGIGWATGPLVTATLGRVTLNAGLHVAQRTGLGGAWLLSHVTVDVRVLDGFKVLVQGAGFFEVARESGVRATDLLGNGGHRVLPYAIAGVRFFTRRFAADMGVLVPLSDEAPLYSRRLAVLPWISLSHLF